MRLHNKLPVSIPSLRLLTILNSSMKMSGLSRVLNARNLPLLVSGDVLSGSTSGAGQHFTGVLEEWAGGPAWWNERLFVLFTITSVILLPLVSLRHLGMYAKL